MKRNVVAFLGKKNLSIDELLDNTKAHRKHYLDPSEQSNNVLCLADHKSLLSGLRCFQVSKLMKKISNKEPLRAYILLK